MNINLVKHPLSELNEKSKATIIFLICLSSVFLFVYTAGSKIIQHDRFLDGIKNVNILSPYATFLSWIVPISELFVSGLLLIPKTYRIGLSSFLFLMITFTVYIVGMLLFADKLPCHCGGVIESLTWFQHVLFNLLFIVLALVALSLSNDYQNSIKNEKF
ncbi:hypothetical protein DIU31_006190 [Mucilaginibacter rubeus]|uniref:Methylamine utilisation protein MauE domain-containing protein n=1 Tax=Mucilaginibacter rubeus TaxID=2027860 RepID=A0AAE6JCR3_9SPHI|nr:MULTISPECIES: MauE/DoxX family redox-associated membrane protein [Mucilaginibacter]QEM03131.1 hypothetical protein DIU31_006190 [Mucilaginibacter rubeus]QEM15749.1 hypothetical protein DIU38_006260 [Mucilaginibacter gossypii]QTE41510.1 hypothetical protein J3L19_21515 [Mucilaginibacter rubeus]QTE48116.1 hypothetical protein J3L21_21515 [Mucilaginibacter rubeus]QTE59507.1 hypothetical protein J3L23_13160 [Mucilaginibacter rubeus]